MPHVISTDADSVHPPCPIDDTLRESLPDHILVHRVPYTNRLQSLLMVRNRIRKSLHLLTPALSHPRQEDAHTNSRSSGKHSAFTHVKQLLLDWAFDFPDPQQAWFHPAVEAAITAAKGAPPDLIFATGGPWTGLLVGRELAHRLRVPFVADFRDPWMCDSPGPFASSFLNNKSERLEAAVCLSAAAVVANTEELRLEFVKRYPSLAQKFVTITNGFNFESRGLQVQTNHPLSPDRTSVLEFCHFGNVYRDRNAAALLRAVLELHNESRLTSAQVRLRFVGSWETEDRVSQELIKQLEQVGLLRRQPPLPHRQCLQEMVAAGALLILQPHSNARIPAKTYEYIASGRPIVLIGEEGAASHLIQKNRLGVWCHNSVPAIKSLIASILDRKTIVTAPAREDVGRFHYRQLTGQLADLFNALSPGGL